MTDLFGNKITREIWANVENVILVYLGSAADFALNPENHWLFFTNKLPSNPQQRFMETFAHNQKIFLGPKDEIPVIARRIRNIHTYIEKQRTKEESNPNKIPNKAFIEVGDMLIDYGIRGYEYLHRRTLPDREREIYYQDERQFFNLMGISDLDASYKDFRQRRAKSIAHDLQINEYTNQLYAAYRKDLGAIGYWIFIQFQAHFINQILARRLHLKKNLLFTPLYKLYPYLSWLGLFNIFAWLFLKREVRALLAKMKQKQPS
jgi:hypothetical protein